VKYSSNIWKQLKSITADDFISALLKDNFVVDVSRGSKRVYRHNDGRRVAIDYHPGKTFGKNLLKALLADTRWTEDNFKRLKLIK